MKLQPVNWKEKFHIGKGFRLPTYVWVSAVALMMLISGTLAWYTLRKANQETSAANVMKPYYLTLLNPSETDVLQLSVGSLLQGKTKQIVFCVSSKEDPQINPDTTVFEYWLELVHTDNLALNYEIYPLVQAADGESDIIVAEDILTTDGASTVETTYWKKAGGALAGTNVSVERRVQAGVAEVNASTDDIVNRGTYISYADTENGLELQVGGGTYTSQYFVLEISWSIDSGFEKYDKETDMIYLLAKALQPEP